MQKILLSAILVIAFAVPFLTQAISSNPYITRAQLVKILKQEKPTSHIVKKLRRPRDSVTLAEAAVFITNAFELEKPKNPSLEWFEPSLIALESKNAIPTSIFTVAEKLSAQNLKNSRMNGGLRDHSTSRHE